MTTLIQYVRVKEKLLFLHMSRTQFTMISRGRDGNGCGYIDGDGRNQFQGQFFVFLTKTTRQATTTTTQQAIDITTQIANMMSVTKIIALAASLMSFFALTHGAKDELLRKKSTTDRTRSIQNISKTLALSDSDVQSAFRELLDTSMEVKWDISMSLSMSMSYSGSHSSSTVVLPPAIVTSTVAPVVVVMEPTPMTPLVNPVVTDNNNHNNKKATGEMQEQVNRGGLTGGTIVGVSVAAVAMVAVAAMVLVKMQRTTQQ